MSSLGAQQPTPGSVLVRATRDEIARRADSLIAELPSE